MKRKKMVKVNEEWYPCFHGGMVEISIHKDGPSDWRVAVWGEDDFGMEKGGLDQDAAFSLFRALTDGLTQSSLKERGFIRA